MRHLPILECEGAKRGLGCWIAGRLALLTLQKRFVEQPAAYLQPLIDELKSLWIEGLRLQGKLDRQGTSRAFFSAQKEVVSMLSVG